MAIVIKSGFVASAILALTLSGCASMVAGSGPEMTSGKATATAIAAPPAAVIPQPASLQAGQGVFTLQDRARIVVPTGDVAAKAAAERFADLMQRTRGLSVSVGDGDGGDIRLVRTAGAKPDSYELVVQREGVTVSATDDAGLQYGLITLWQLATQTDSGPAPIAAVRIADAPRFAWRGVMLDSARHYQSPEFIKSFIDWMALHKLNVFHWHLTDDQAWRLEIRSHPKLTEVGAFRVPEGHAAQMDIDPATGRPRLYGGFYTQDQVREIVDYAAARSITIVPEIEVPGHASAAVVAYPELGVQDASNSAVSAVPSDWGVYHTLFNTKPETIRFLEDVLDETMALFPGQYIHLGGDEAVKDQWKASPSVQAHMRELGITDENAMQGWFMGELEKYLNQHGRRLIGWDEILEGGRAGDATIMSWRGIDGAIEAARLGHDTVLTPAPTFYLNNSQSLNDGSPGPAAVVTLRDLYDYDPIPSALTAAQASHVLGVQANIWTEYILEGRNVEYMAYPRIAALSELAWSAPERTEWTDFSARLQPQLARYRGLGIDYATSALDTEKHAPPADGERRYDHQMRLCSPDGYILNLTDDAPVRGERAAFTTNLYDACWIYEGADLTGGKSVEAGVGQVPFNFQIGKDIANVKTRAPATPSGEFVVRLDTCDGPVVLSIPLTEAAKSDGITVLRGQLPATAGKHDLCLTFTQTVIDPIWAVDWLRLTSAGSN